MILRPNDLSCVWARLSKRWEMEQIAKRANEMVSTVMASKSSHIVTSATFDIPLIGGERE